MLDLNIPLGREVPTAAQILSLIRPELRFARIVAKGSLDAMREGWLEHNDDYELTDGGDQTADQAMFAALRVSAMGSVLDWTRDMHLVFDRAKVEEFIRQALIAATDPEQLPSDALDY